ncbi:hypothetical protein F5Y12DRAFT_791200 [Xylaria sp. FL1777]|nr:hypothetical protein F5Y12DRAFT_791200 [Xylaria sp. FL1777]
MRGSSSRRFHTKSRNGCGRCRKRRVKCDMKTPVCSHCRRRREECDYRDGSGSRIDHVESVQIELAASPMHGTTTSNADAMDSNAILTHYMNVTSRTLWLTGEDGDEEFNPWRKELAPLLQTLPFLHSIIISLSALHIYHCLSSATTRSKFPENQSTPRSNLRTSSDCRGGYESQLQAKDYAPFPSTSAPQLSNLDSRERDVPNTKSSSLDMLNLAYSNQIVGSKTFRRAVPVVNSSNWVPVMAFTIAVLVFRLDSCRQSTTFSGVVTDPLLALRSAGTMGNEIKPFFLGSGAFGEYLMRRARRSAPKVVDSGIVLALAHLKTINEERKVADISESAEQSICARAIDSLQRWAIFVSGKPRTWLHYVWWPAEVPGEFVDLVHQKNPAALLVFVYWCAVLDRANQRWFLKGWASKAGGVAMAEMGPGAWIGHYKSWGFVEVL